MLVTLLLALSLSAAPGAQSPDLAARNRAAEQAMNTGRFDDAVAIYREILAAAPDNPETLLNLAEAELAAGRPVEATADVRKATSHAPGLPAAWYSLGRAYDAVAQQARATFDRQPDEAPWRQLIVADGLLARGQLTGAFVAYRAALADLPAMVSIHDTIAQIYDRSGHADWGRQERAAAAAVDCTQRKALCEFRAGRYAPALDAALGAQDPESRYWRTRAATALALAAFAHLDRLPDSPERRTARAALARDEERYTDAIAELQAALKLAPGDPPLVNELAAMYFQARDFEKAIDALQPLLRRAPDDPGLLKMVGSALLEMRQPDEAVPALERAQRRAPADRQLSLLLARAYLQTGAYAAALPLLEAQLAGDADGSLHLQAARACAALGQRERAGTLLDQGQALQREADARRSAAAQRTITPPGK